MEDIDDDLIAQPHDAFVKSIMSELSFAQAFFQEHLPTSVTSRVDWASLQLMPGSFVKQSLKQAHSDLLFSVNADAVPCLLYLLFEHQTTVDDLMPLRLLGYIHEILRAHVEAHGKPLPPVLPLVLHQGPNQWTASPQFEELFALPSPLADALHPFLPKFRHGLLDLSQFEPRKNGANPIVRAMLLLLKLARQRQAKEFFTWLQDQVMLPKRLLRRSLLYALYAEPILDVEAIADSIQRNAILKEEIMSTATALIARGREEGLSAGRKEGKAEGVMIGKLTFLQELMKVPVSSFDELSKLDLAQLETLYAEAQRRYDERFKG